MRKIIIILLLSLFPLTTFAGTTLYSKTNKLPNGLRVCALKNDKPKISTQNKKVHLDRECCLDNREIPNPRCYYPTKYQKLIDKYNTKLNTWPKLY